VTDGCTTVSELCGTFSSAARTDGSTLGAASDPPLERSRAAENDTTEELVLCRARRRRARLTLQDTSWLVSPQMDTCSPPTTSSSSRDEPARSKLPSDFCVTVMVTLLSADDEARALASRTSKSTDESTSSPSAAGSTSSWIEYVNTAGCSGGGGAGGGGTGGGGDGGGGRWWRRRGRWR